MIFSFLLIVVKIVSDRDFKTEKYVSRCTLAFSPPSSFSGCILHWGRGGEEGAGRGALQTKGGRRGSWGVGRRWGGLANKISKTETKTRRWGGLANRIYKTETKLGGGEALPIRYIKDM